MIVADLAIRPAVTTLPDTRIDHVAALMTKAGVGSVIVVDHDRLVGIVTDRDLVVRVLALGLPGDARIDSVMSMNVVAVDAHADIRDAITSFGHHAVRRMPVVSGDQVVGLVSLDDLIVSLSTAFADVARGVNAQMLFPHASDPAAVPATA
ncbi:MAG: signal transduction protein [Acidimicrobiaceae bacterium]|nr:MAG: signal transduction protein [Acidimicrobiaceae bacterium]